MANKRNTNLTILAAPTHILIEEGKKKERVMYSNHDGLIFFNKGFQPKRGKTYRLIPNEAYEAYKASK